MTKLKKHRFPLLKTTGYFLQIKKPLSQYVHLEQTFLTSRALGSHRERSVITCLDAKSFLLEKDKMYDFIWFPVPLN